MSSQAWIAGVYPSLAPADRGRPESYATLAEAGFADGLELPYLGESSVEDWLALAPLIAGKFPRCVVTTIPSDMAMQNTVPGYGLASTSAGARQAALREHRAVRDGVAALTEAADARVVEWVQLHSAPSRDGDPEQFFASLHEILGWNWSGAHLVVEHCDGRGAAREGGKQLLDLSDELEVCNQLDIGVTINWGRSVLEGKGPEQALKHVKEAVGYGALAGVMFSGIGPTASEGGGPWADVHLAMSEDEPVSLMTAAAVAECARAARDASYLGAKMHVPTGRDWVEGFRRAHRASTLR